MQPRAEESVIKLKNGREIPVIIKKDANAPIILKKIKSALDMIQPAAFLDTIQSVTHFAGCSNHACEIKTNSNPSSVFLRVPGDPSVILDNREPDAATGKPDLTFRTEGILVNRAMEDLAVQAFHPEEAKIDHHLGCYFDEAAINAGFKLEPFTPGCEVLAGKFNQENILKSSMEVMREFHSEEVLKAWEKLVDSRMMAEASAFDKRHPPKENTERKPDKIIHPSYNILERIDLMLHGMDAVHSEEQKAGAKPPANPYRLFGTSKDFYSKGIGAHLNETNNTFEIPATRNEIRELCDRYGQMKEAMCKDDSLRLCHNDLSGYNFMTAKENLDGSNPSVKKSDIQLIDFEFAAKNDPMCDLAYLISEEKSTLLSEDNIRALLDIYHGGEEVKPGQIDKELDRIAYYLPLIDLKVSVWSAYQVMVENESANQKGMTVEWGPDRWNAFVKTLDNDFVKSRFSKNHKAEELYSIKKTAEQQTKVENVQEAAASHRAPHQH